MDIQEIRQIMKDFSESSLVKMNLEWDGVTLQMEKELSRAGKAVDYVPAVEPVNKAIDQKSAEKAPAELAGTEVKSPVVGVYYSAPSPGAAPFVTIGQHVEKGQVLCIVEAMKMMNEITAPVSGTLTNILVEQEAVVEYGQVLMLIK